MKLVKYQDIKHLLPEDTHYKNERYYDPQEAYVLHYGRSGIGKTT